MIAVAGLPSASPSRSADSFVIAATTWAPPMSSVTSAITAPIETPVTVPRSWFRALVSTSTSLATSESRKYGRFPL